MPIRFNIDTNPDYIMTQHQGRLIPTQVRTAIDDAENISGGVQPGGGSASAAGGGAAAAASAQQNLSQIQENPLPPCVAHGTLIDVWFGDEWREVLVQDVMPDWLLKYDDRRNYVEQIDRVWCTEQWFIRADNGKQLYSSADHRIITDINDWEGTPVNTLKAGDTWLTRNGLVNIVESLDPKRHSWVYRISLKDEGTAKSHWFVSNSGVSHNVKPSQDER